MRFLNDAEIKEISGAGTVAAINVAPVALFFAIGGTLISSLSFPILIYQGKGFSGCLNQLAIGLGVGILIEQTALQW